MTKSYTQWNLKCVMYHSGQNQKKSELGLGVVLLRRYSTCVWHLSSIFLFMPLQLKYWSQTSNNILIIQTQYTLLCGWPIEACRPWVRPWQSRVNKDPRKSGWMKCEKDPWFESESRLFWTLPRFTWRAATAWPCVGPAYICLCVMAWSSGLVEPSGAILRGGGAL